MRTAKGGTEMYCGYCKTLTTCKAISVAQITGNSIDYAQHFHSTKYIDLNWFQRGRECLSCGTEFTTAEIDKDILDELIKLRDAIGDITANVDTYMNESKSASQSLKKLTSSLGVLRALKLYKTVKK